MRVALLGPVDGVARLLLGSRVVSDVGGQRVVVRIVETEAYAGQGLDPASHAHRGRTRRNASMFAAPGTAYVYFTYGMHWCLNVAVEPVGSGAAVLLRSGVIEDGLAAARARRVSASGRVPPDRELARGPARLCRALGVTGEQDGLDLLDPISPLRLTLPASPATLVSTGPRVGVRGAAERPWRYWLSDEPAVSAYRAAQDPRRIRRRDR